MCVLHQAVKPPRGVTPSSRSSKPGVCREQSDHDNQARVLQTARKWPLQPGRRGRSLWARASVCEVLTAEQHSSHQGRRPLAGPAGRPEASAGPRRPDASPPPLTPAEPTRWNAPSFWENFTCSYTRAGFGGQGVWGGTGSSHSGGSGSWGGQCRAEPWTKQAGDAGGRWTESALSSSFSPRVSTP